MCDELINSFKKELDRKSKLEKTKFNVNLIDRFKVIIDSLIKFEPRNLQLTKLKGDFDSFTYFIYNYRKIRISLLGGYSTGKSSFLNNLIGQDILPVNINK
jgi:ribosome biogenesis GTPase A